jgi:hypothetical protein
MLSLQDLVLAGSRLVALTMAARSTPPVGTADKLASNGTNHDAPDASNDNDTQWIRDLVLGINTMFKNLDIQREELRKIQDDVFILRRSIADIQKALDGLKQLVPQEPEEPEPL